jgi:hypothetical protein
MATRKIDPGASPVLLSLQEAETGVVAGFSSPFKTPRRAW